MTTEVDTTWRYRYGEKEECLRRGTGDSGSAVDGRRAFEYGPDPEYAGRKQELGAHDRADVDPETGEDLSNVETSLRNVGIELRASTGEFRDFDDVLDETASRWNSFSEVTQRSIAASFAGTNHLNEFMVLMQNYSSALEYMDIANESSGQSMEKFSAYQDSMAGKLEGLKNQFQQLSSVTFDSNFLKGMIDAGTTALGVITDLIDNFGILQSLFTVGGGILGAKGLGKSKNVMPFSIKLSKIIAA